jgi:hypothetical protein
VADVGWSGGPTSSIEQYWRPSENLATAKVAVDLGRVQRIQRLRMNNFRYSNTGTTVEPNDGNVHETAACLDGTLQKKTNARSIWSIPTTVSGG